MPTFEIIDVMRDMFMYMIQVIDCVSFSWPPVLPPVFVALPKQTLQYSGTRSDFFMEHSSAPGALLGRPR